MSIRSQAALKPAVVYPDDDGEPMADNTLQFDWISLLKWSAEAQFRNDPNVFVAGNHLIYPIEGDNLTRQAPDTYVAFGRPKGYRGSYKVWEEGDVFPQVIFEVHSPNNRAKEMERKRLFYERFGAEEYYYVFPYAPAHVEGWRAIDGQLVLIPNMKGHVSPRLGWRFEFSGEHLFVYGSDGRLLRMPDEVAAERDAAELRAERERRRADKAKQQADKAKQQADTLAAKMRELGLDPDNL